MKALVTTTPARAYTIRHPDGRLVAEVLDGGLMLLRWHSPSGVAGAWGPVHHPTSDQRSAWEIARERAVWWARDEWGLDVPEPDADELRPRAAIDAHLDRVVAGAKAAERERIVAWMRTYDEASTHDEVARMLADRIERGQHEEDEGNG